MEHKLKIYPEYFTQVCNGRKSFEIRKNDRNFQVGDLLVLQEYCPIIQDYTGREVKKEVTYITDFEQRDGYVVMSIK